MLSSSFLVLYPLCCSRQERYGFAKHLLVIQQLGGGTVDKKLVTVQRLAGAGTRCMSLLSSPPNLCDS